MEIVCDFVNRNYAKIPFKISIDGGAKILGSKGALEYDAGNLTLGMHARICPTRTVNLHPLAVEQRQRASQFALNSAFSGLDLPSVKIRAIILNSQLEVHMAINPAW